MADPEARKILQGAWATSGDRTDPDAVVLDPVLDRDTGWPSTFSASDGETPRRRVFNQLLNELDSAAIDSMRWGILPYDALIDYHQHARATVDDREFRALTANGPGTTAGAVSPTAVGQTAWQEVAGVVGGPSAPAAPQATAPRSRTLDWFWACPLDGGAQVTSFEFQWRVSATMAWSVSQTVTTPRFELTSLTNGTTYEARVKAINSAGESGWSAVGQATAAGSVPGGGASLALRADGGDTEADLGWLEPDDGGVAITSYEVQWRSGSQSFSVGRQVSVTETSATVAALVNGTEYFFQVRAVNGQGNGAWSNEASATPAEPAATEAIPDDIGAAPTGTAGNGSAMWAWECPSDNGADISGFEFRFRAVGTNVWTDRTTTLATRTETGLVNGTSYEAQARAVNSVGTAAGWSPSGSVTPQAEEPDRVQFVALSNAASGIRADWGEPDANGDAIDRYDVQIANNSAFVAPTTVQVTAGRTHTFTGLNEGTTYHVRVRAVNGAGNGDWSPAASLARDDGMAVPDEPDAPVARARRPLLVDWSWLAGSDNGADISGFQLQWRYSGSSWSGNVVDVTEALATIEVADDTLGVDVRVRAINSVGTGDWSATGSIDAADLLDAVPRRLTFVSGSPVTVAGYNTVLIVAGVGISGTMTVSGSGTASVQGGVPVIRTQVTGLSDGDTFTVNVTGLNGSRFLYPQPSTA